MFRFWNSVIQPVIHALRPAVLVEIGASYGHNTVNLLEYCRQNSAVLHSIDPAPRFSPEELKQKYGGEFIFHSSLSLGALDAIDDMDVVLIDGDHNWYTVYNELKKIEEISSGQNRKFPVTFFHDIAWPYGRRDLYYDPEQIPEKFRKPYARKGLHPDSAILLDEGGLSPHLCNAVSENDPQNGVLTAIEDFLEESGNDLAMIQIPLLFGLGLLYPTDLADANPGFAAILHKLSLSEEIRSLMEEADTARIKTIINKNRIEVDSARYQQEAEFCREKIAAQDRELGEATRRLEQLAEELEDQRKKNSELAGLLQRHNDLLNSLELNFQDLMRSRRWKIGNGAGRILQTLTGKKREFRAPAEIRKILDDIRRLSGS